jgi:hypothetical protein
LQFAKIEPGVRSDDDAEPDRLRLQPRLHPPDRLDVTGVERHSNAEQGSQLPNPELLGGGQGTVKPMVGFRRRLPMVPHQAGDDILLVPAQAGEIGVAHQVFSVLVVSARVYGVADVVQQRSQFERYALSGREFVRRSELMEQLRGQTPHVFAMGGVGVHARGKPPRLLAQRFGPFIVRRSRAEVGRRQVMQNSLAHADTRDDEMACAQPFAHRDEHHCGHAHHLGTIAPHTEYLHALLDVEPQNFPETVAEVTQMDGVESGDARSRDQAGQGLGVSPAGHRRPAPQTRVRAALRPEYAQYVPPQSCERFRRKRSRQVELLH